MADSFDSSLLSLNASLDELLHGSDDDLDNLEDSMGEDELGDEVDDLEASLGEDEDFGEDEDGLGEDEDFGEDEDGLGEDDEDFGEDDEDGLGEDDEDFGEDDEDGLGEDDDFGEDDEDGLGEDDDFGEDDEDGLGEDDDDLGIDDLDEALGEDDEDFGEDDEDFGEDDEDFGEDDEDFDEDFGEDEDVLGEDEDFGEEDEFGKALDVDDIPDMTDKKLKAVAKNLFRKKAIRQAAKAELAKRAARGSAPSASTASGPSEEEMDAAENAEEEYGDDSEMGIYGDDVAVLGEDDGMGMDDYVEFVESFGAFPTRTMHAAAKIAAAGPFAPIALASFLLSKKTRSSDGTTYNRHQLVAAIPYLRSSQLRDIAANSARKRWVRKLVAAEVSRREARKTAGNPVTVRAVPRSGRVNVTHEVPMSKINSFTSTYRSPTRAMQAVVRRPKPAAATSSTPTGVPLTNADRRAQEQRMMARAAQHNLPMRQLPVALREKRAAQVARRAQLPIARPVMRPMMARGGRNEDMLGSLVSGDAEPTIGQAVMSHPFQTLLLGGALFGVGALVGQERIVDAGLAIGDAVTGTAHGVFSGARRRRAR